MGVSFFEVSFLIFIFMRGFLDTDMAMPVNVFGRSTLIIYCTDCLDITEEHSGCNKKMQESHKKVTDEHQSWDLFAEKVVDKLV
jgi:hypothetical protein